MKNQFRRTDCRLRTGRLANVDGNVGTTAAISSTVCATSSTGFWSIFLKYFLVAVNCLRPPNTKAIRKLKFGWQNSQNGWTHVFHYCRLWLWLVMMSVWTNYRRCDRWQPLMVCTIRWFWRLWNFVDVFSVLAANRHCFGMVELSLWMVLLSVLLLMTPVPLKLFCCEYFWIITISSLVWFEEFTFCFSIWCNTSISITVIAFLITFAVIVDVFFSWNRCCRRCCGRGAPGR